MDAVSMFSPATASFSVFLAEELLLELVLSRLYCEDLFSDSATFYAIAPNWFDARWCPDELCSTALLSDIIESAD